ncbi:low-density lipoprotein receptor-related protein 12-like [Ornithodoros turicata]|uniref:low-density lipoprotein receptor-related protein 12-like n=1 Tax=Ornithodoros turicata TaxID=34597 RepID=UPI003138E4BE
MNANDQTDWRKQRTIWYMLASDFRSGHCSEDEEEAASRTTREVFATAFHFLLALTHSTPFRSMSVYREWCMLFHMMLPLWKVILCHEGYIEEPFFDLCGKAGLSLEATGLKSARKLTAVQPRQIIREKCTFEVKANNSDGVVLFIQEMKLRTSKAVDDVCIDYVEFTADTGKSHITVCGETMKSYDTGVPLNISLYLNPTQFYEPGTILKLVLTGFNKTTQVDCNDESFRCSNSRCIWKGFMCDETDNCGDDSDEKYFVSSMCYMPMAALVLIISGILIILISLFMICYCMARLHTQLQRALEEERAYRDRRMDSFSEGPYSEFVDTYGSLIPKMPLMSTYQANMGGDSTGPYARRASARNYSY